MKKVCFIVISPFTERDFKRFGISEFNNNFDILILDCTPFLDKKFEEYIFAEDISIKKKYIKRCHSFFKFIKYFLGFKPNWTVYLISLYGKEKYFQRLILRLIVKLNSKIIHYRTGAYPNYSTLPIDKNSKLKIILENLKIIFRKIIYFPLEILSPNKVVIGGFSEFKKLKDKNKAIFAHNLDYDNFLDISRNRNSYNNNKLRYLLFLDEDFPCHSDYFRFGISPGIDEIKYFREMSNSLELIGNNFDLKPIIKLHPRANFKKSSKLYSIDIAYEDTAKLVSASDLVIAHCSTSIQLAVLFYKPIILIIPDELPDNNIYRFNIDYFKNELDIPCYRNKDIKQIQKIPLVNFEKYNLYKEKFIKMKISEEKYSWEIIIKNLMI